ncbi:MAG: ketopantoate reductase family protein [Pseudomonadota bacterium]
MRTAIVGAGALGSVLGCLLWEAGADVTLVRRDVEQVAIARERGIWIEGVSGDRSVKPQVLAEQEDCPPVDLALVLVKAYDTEAAIPAVKSRLKEDGVVLTLQNGVGNFEILEKAFPGRVLLGTTTTGALALGSGRYRHTGYGQTHVGEPGGTVTDRLRNLAALLEKMNTGPVHVVENAFGCVWSKLVINAAINAPATLLRVPNGELPASLHGRDLIHDVVEECKAVIRAKDIRLIFDDPEAMVIAVCEGTATNRNSMFQDILAGRRTEIDRINGAVVREGEASGIPTPVNKTVTLLVKALEGVVSRHP